MSSIINPYDRRIRQRGQQEYKHILDEQVRQKHLAQPVKRRLDTEPITYSSRPQPSSLLKKYNTPNPKRRKFIQYSEFLPAIQPKDRSVSLSHQHRRWNSEYAVDDEGLADQESDYETAEYLN